MVNTTTKKTTTTRTPKKTAVGTKASVGNKTTTGTKKSTTAGTKKTTTTRTPKKTTVGTKAVVKNKTTTGTIKSNIAGTKKITNTKTPKKTTVGTKTPVDNKTTTGTKKSNTEGTKKTTTTRTPKKTTVGSKTPLKKITTTGTKNSNISANIKGNYFCNKKNILSGVIIILLIVLFGGFTKLGVIPNFLESELLCPIGEDVNSSASIPSGYSDPDNGMMIAHKPVIYLYTEEKVDVKVSLEFDGDLFADYPDYNYDINGWDVIAYPDSTIIDKSDNKEYSYLFWEGKPKEEINWNIDKGFVIKGSDTKQFLQEILPKMGLTPKEYNEFIVYWYPIMQVNEYNLIHFSGEQYTDMAPLKTEPSFDSLLRVFMVVKPINEPIDIEPQTFEKFERNGFTVVEWGGTILNNFNLK